MKPSTFFKSTALLMTGLVHFSFAATPIITNYTQLVTSLEQGNDVKAIIHLDKCFLNAEGDSVMKQITTNLTGASTRFNFNQYTHYQMQVGDKKKDTVVTSIAIPTQHQNGEFLINYARLHLFTDNSANLYLAYFDPLTNKKKSSIDWTCYISNGNDKNAIMLYLAQS